MSIWGSSCDSERMKLLTLLFFAATLFAADPVMPDTAIMNVTHPDKINWQKGATQDVATLQGDPSKPGLYM